jgi:hypothetical protein
MSGSHGAAAAMMSSKGFAIFEDSDIAVSIEISRSGLSLTYRTYLPTPSSLIGMNAHSLMRLGGRGVSYIRASGSLIAKRQWPLSPYRRTPFTQTSSHPWITSATRRIHTGGSYRNCCRTRISTSGNHNALHALADQWCDAELFLQHEDSRPRNGSGKGELDNPASRRIEPAGRLQAVVTRRSIASLSWAVVSRRCVPLGGVRAN